MPRYCKIVFVIVLLVILAVPLKGQHQHQLKHYSPPSDVVYTIKVDVIPDSSNIKGSVEVSFTNKFAVALDSVYLSVPFNLYQDNGIIEKRYTRYDDSSWLELSYSERPYTRIDSILYQGVPMEYLERSNSIITVPLMPPVSPGEKGHLYLTFESQLPQQLDKKHHSITAINWFPELRYPDSTKSIKDSRGWNYLTGPQADYQLSATVDTAFDLICPGSFLDRMAHFGIVQTLPDSPLVDIKKNYSKNLRGEPYQSIFKDAVKQYLYKATSVDNFTLIITDKYKYDQFNRTDYTISTAYSNRVKYDWPSKMLLLADSVYASLINDFGYMPYDTLSVVAVDTTLCYQYDEPLVPIASDIKKDHDMKSALVYNLAQLFVRHGAVYTNDESFIQGLAYYLTSSILYKNDTLEGNSNLYNYEKRLKDKSILSYYFKDNKSLMSYVDSVPVSDPMLQNDFPLLKESIYSGYRTYPVMLRVLQFMIGELQLTEVIHRFLQQTERSQEKFEELTEQVSGENYNWFFKQWDANARADFGIKNPGCTDSTGVITFSCTIEKVGDPIIPMEIALITTAPDTLLDTVDLKPNTNVPYVYSRSVSSEIDKVVLDPFYHLPDTNRYDNIYYRLPRRHVLNPPRNLFVGYRDW